MSEQYNYKKNTDIMEYKSLPSVKEEKQLALSMYDIMLKNSLIGYEAANHYYFNCGKDSKL